MRNPAPPPYTPVHHRRVAAWTVLGTCAGWTIGGVVVYNSVSLWFVVLLVLCSMQFLIGVLGWM